MNVDNIRDHLLTAPSEYSYFDTGRFGGWAGPRHWKFKPLHRLAGASLIKASANGNAQNANADDEVAAKRKKSALKNSDEIHNFLMLLEASLEEMESNGSTALDRLEKNMSRPRRAIQLVKKTMENWEEERVVLPKDLHYKVMTFLIWNVQQSNFYGIPIEMQNMAKTISIAFGGSRKLIRWGDDK